METIVARPIGRIVTAHSQREGAGFVVRRPFPVPGLEQVDPFLLLDEMGPVTYQPGEATGAPDHPHRGFETVTYVLDGEFEHEDSAGHRGKLGPGDMQWMTAGRGVVHSEMPSGRVRTEGGRVHGFQIWVNLPKQDKWAAPRYQEVRSSELPRAQTLDGLAKVTVLAGEALGARAVIETKTPILFHDWRLAPGASVDLPVPDAFHVLVYVYEGTLQVGPSKAMLNAGQLAILTDKGRVEFSARPDAGSGGRALLLGGVPLREPVVRYGPFVMNNRQEILQAVQDFQEGRMGEITR